MKKLFTILIFLHLCVLFAAPDKQRIISLSPTITRQLYLLGAGNEIVGDTTYCNLPEQAKHKTKIGSVVNVNVEKILTLKPDIIIASRLTDKKNISELKKLGLTNIKIFLQPKTYNEICKQFLRLGKLVGKEKKAQDIIAESKRKVNSIVQKTENLPTKKVLVQVGASPLFVSSGNTFVNDVIKFAGGVNIAVNDLTGIYSIEEAVEKKPDVIIVSLMGSMADSSIQTWKKFKTIPAVKNGMIYHIDPDLLCSPNPETFPKLLRKVVEMIHPKLKLKD
ncbi:MAG: ABC transporter substrate-binding protein [Victivallales bacterium]|nr:ABC transporter substrate-binding protein [Victivallales bacterium]